MAEGISKILNKRSNVSGKKPTNLEYGEIAINYASGNEAIIIKNSDDQMVEFKANPTIDTTQFVTLDTEQTISGEKTFNTIIAEKLRSTSTKAIIELDEDLEYGDQSAISLGVYDNTNSYPMTPSAALVLNANGQVNALGEWYIDDVNANHISAYTITKINGTSSQVLMADGSVREASTLGGGGGNIDTSNLVTTNTKQTISAPKEFKSDVTIGDTQFSDLKGYYDGEGYLNNFSGLSVKNGSELYLGKGVDSSAISMKSDIGYFNFSDTFRIRALDFQITNYNSFDGPHKLQFGIDANFIEVMSDELGTRMEYYINGFGSGSNEGYIWYYIPNHAFDVKQQLMSLDKTSTLTVDKIVTSIDGGEF